MKKISAIMSSLALTFALALTSISAMAQYTGPSSTPLETNLANVLKNPIDDQPVKLEGYIIRKVGKERYIFSDGKNEIRVEIDDDDLPPKNFNEKTKVIIYGEVEKKRKMPRIDVDRVEVK